ncbi:MAG: DNA polymerase subunit beta [Promethearchaeota archaeon Loki_b32]|nr:MAG: DNA polymerase subunit beta [Candidatus Lokiarchaeota archaeon Loki_b32]
MKLSKINEFRKLLAPFQNKFEAILYGSYVEGAVRPNSDIDIAIISREKDLKENLKLQKEVLGKVSLKFDIRVFELLPIYIQISIINNYQVIFGNPLEISEYFYFYRKKWDDCKNRILSNQFSSYRERLSLIE